MQIAAHAAAELKNSFGRERRKQTRDPPGMARPSAGRQVVAVPDERRTMGMARPRAIATKADTVRNGYASSES